MTKLIEYLESFNRKERFFLIAQALGNPKFHLSEEFQASLSEAFGILVPGDAFVAMDYHIDWIHSSLFLTFQGDEDTSIHPNTGNIATGNQEDVDLLVAYEDGPLTHILLIEAKAETGWTNKQTLSKASRLRNIFGDEGTRYNQVRPHFCLMSPRVPSQLESKRWPSWMTHGGEPLWIKLDVPAGRRKVTRCDEMGKSRASGNFFKVVGGKEVGGS